MSQITIDPISLKLEAAPAVKSANPAPLAIELLLWRMRDGDRDAAAEFLMRYGSRIRRRIRGKLNPSIRRLFDSMDILSTLGRRLDLYVMSGRLKVNDEGQLWSLLCKMADHALIDKARIFKNVQNIENQDSNFAYQNSRVRQEQQNVARQNSASQLDVGVEQCLAWLSDPIEKRILAKWLVGESYAAIGQPLGFAEDSVRKRLDRIQAKLKVRFQTSGTWEE